jgi:FkbM family methyltransferase
MSYPEEQACLVEVLQKFSTPVIVDLGARRGEDTRWMLEAVADRQPWAICVEADIGNFLKLQASGLSATFVYGAIADHEGSCFFWENHDFEWGFGSIYDPVPGKLSVDYHKFIRTGPIPCFTFDTLCDKFHVDQISLICADIHGAEKDMIKHGQRALRRTSYLFVEFFNEPMYYGMATKKELLAMLPGWQVAREFPWNMLLKNQEVQDG